jgi:pimeloyl-ACP methyl ester carboxylesterase
VADEGAIEAGGIRLPYRATGDGPPLVHLGEAPPPAAALDALARRFRVLAFEMPAAGRPPAARTLASALGRALGDLGVERFNLLGSARGCLPALWLAAEDPARVLALVLESPADPGDAELERRLADLPVPTLAVLGTVDAAPGAGRAYPRLMPSAHLVFVYGAGRTIGADRPEAFVEVAADFLERHEAFVISRTDTVIHP